MGRCGLCGQPGNEIVRLRKDKRRLCKHHYQQYLAKEGDHKVVFQRASGNPLKKSNQKDK